MDEIDSIGSSRIDSDRGGDSEVQRTMLELLNQLDGFEPSANIKVIYFHFSFFLFHVLFLISFENSLITSADFNGYK